MLSSPVRYANGLEDAGSLADRFGGIVSDVVGERSQVDWVKVLDFVDRSGHFC